MRIGMAELVLVFIIALFALGPDRLPAYAKKMGEAVSQFKKYSEEATQEIKKNVVEPLEEAQAPLREAAKPLEDLDKTVRGNAKEVRESFAGIGREKPPAPPELKAEAAPEPPAGEEDAPPETTV